MRAINKSSLSTLTLSSTEEERGLCDMLSYKCSCASVRRSHHDYVRLQNHVWRCPDRPGLAVRDSLQIHLSESVDGAYSRCDSSPGGDAESFEPQGELTRRRFAPWNDLMNLKQFWEWVPVLNITTQHSLFLLFSAFRTWKSRIPTFVLIWPAGTACWRRCCCCPACVHSVYPTPCTRTVTWMPRTSWTRCCVHCARCSASTWPPATCETAWSSCCTTWTRTWATWVSVTAVWARWTSRHWYRWGILGDILNRV